MTKFHIPFIKYRFWFIAASIILFVLAVFFIAKNGLNYGIDFKGGAKLEYKFKEAVSESAIRSSIEKLNLGSISVVRFGEKSDNRMSIKVELPEEHAQIADKITTALQATFGQDGVALEKEETVGPRVGEELRTRALYTILFSWVLMLIYIGYRFDFQFAPGAVLSLVHDTVITIGVFAFLGKEIDLTILAALLTLIGFSINDTIVVFDRIRENKALITPSSVEQVVEDSINTTFSRTIITSLTVLFVVVVLFFKGGGTLHDFAFAMMVGVIIGTYSSIFVASPIYIGLYHHWPRIRKIWAKR